MLPVNPYRTHYCGELREREIDRDVQVAGWVETIRDHGGVIFLDLRDSTGLVQVVLREGLPAGVSRECVVTAAGRVVRREPETVNPKLATGLVEVRAHTLTLLGRVGLPLPFDVADPAGTREDLRLRYRYLDLRSPRMQQNLRLRAQLLAFLRQQMTGLGFLEVQTPILTASSPEGARDYLIPSRKHKGKFYALPQAPQLFKQLLMVSGVDRYFQIAPCFRDEDARADRSPGEFYQLDFEMAFAGQEEVLSVAEQVLSAAFGRFGHGPVNPAPFPRIPYREAMLRYGTDKPDLRNPLTIFDCSDLFVATDFAPFRGRTVRAIPVPGAAGRPRSFFEGMEAFALSIGMKGLGYVKVEESAFVGPIDKYLTEEQRQVLRQRGGLASGDLLYFIADTSTAAPRLAGQIRTELGRRLGLVDESAFCLCFVVDFPMYELDEETGALCFTHNPFSMPQGGLQALEEQDPLEVLAWQYDVVCNGVELSSGAVRNHDIAIMRKAFALAGYSEEELQEKFSSLYTAFQYGAPPHAGMAPGVDRMLMLLTGAENIREVVAFPMNSNAQDLMMGSPCAVSEQQLREVHIKLR